MQGLDGKKWPTSRVQGIVDEMSLTSAALHQPVPLLSFRDQLVAEQPGVLRWLESHLEGAQQRAGVELAARYFATTARWGEVMPKLETGHLNEELLKQSRARVDSGGGLANLPLAVAGRDHGSLQRVLRALVRVSQQRS